MIIYFVCSCRYYWRKNGLFGCTNQMKMQFFLYQRKKSRDEGCYSRLKKIPLDYNKNWNTVSIQTGKKKTRQKWICRVRVSLSGRPVSENLCGHQCVCDDNTKDTACQYKPNILKQDFVFKCVHMSLVLVIKILSACLSPFGDVINYVYWQ